MANADRKHFGVGVKGKGDGTGAMSEADTAAIPANRVLSNRDKAQHAQDRGRDSKSLQTEERKDHSANRRTED